MSKLTEMQGVILAAGGGSRLFPLTSDRSKAMMPVLGRPMVERVMDEMAANDIEEFIIVVGPDDGEIREHFLERSMYRAKVHFVIQRKRMGMADALSQAAPHISGDFVLSACDNLVASTDVGRMLDLWRTSTSLNALLTVMPVPPEEVSRVGIVEMDGDRILGIVEKPTLDEALSNIASLPLYCFSPKLLEYLPEVPLSPRGERELQDAIQMLIERDGRVRGLTVQNLLTLTSPADLLAINHHYLARYGYPAKLDSTDVSPSTEFVEPVYVEGGTFIGANCVIGPNVYIERGCRVGDGVRLRDSVLLRDSSVADGDTLEGQIVSGDRHIRSSE